MADQVTRIASRRDRRRISITALSFALLAVPGTVFLTYFVLVEAAGGRNPLGPDLRLIYFYSSAAAILCAPVALLAGLAALMRRRVTIYLVFCVAIALLGGFVALGRSSLWF